MNNKFDIDVRIESFELLEEVVIYIANHYAQEVLNLSEFFEARSSFYLDKLEGAEWTINRYEVYFEDDYLLHLIKEAHALLSEYEEIVLDYKDKKISVQDTGQATGVVVDKLLEKMIVELNVIGEHLEEKMSHYISSRTEPHRDWELVLYFKDNFDEKRGKVNHIKNELKNVFDKIYIERLLDL